MQRLSILCLLLLFLIPIYAQEGQGTIREGTTDSLADVRSFNPLRCIESADSACFWAVQRIFPRLLAIDPETRWYGEGTAENGGLAVSWDISEDNQVYTFHLREDAFWTDGSPITAYDYFYSYLALVSRDFDNSYYERLEDSIEGVVPLSDKELAIIFKENNCDVLQNIFFPIAPAHVFDADFAEQAAAQFGDGDVREQWETWDSSFEHDFHFMVETEFDQNPSVTGGVFDFVGWQRYGYIRLKRGELSLELVPVPNDNEEVDLFLDGDLSFVHNPPANRWADLNAADDVQLFQTPTSRWDYLAFNLEDTEEPESAFDEEGNPIAQEPNRFFADVRVRRAIQLAINVPELIEVGMQGQGSQIAGLFSPVSWAYDESLSPYPYDPEAARDLLDEAGWTQEGDNRRCTTCSDADFGSYLSVDLALGDYEHQWHVANLIAQQLYEVGISVNISGSDFGRVQRQEFHLYLGTWGDEIPRRDLDELFTSKGDIVGEGMNFTSYNNLELTNLLEEAKTLSGCGLEERIDLYQEAQRILYNDLPYLWLYAQDERIAVRGSILNYNPTFGSPLGDLLDWRVFELPRGQS
jgi:peptide/nickel transport system substrate-binding protein